MNDLCLPDTYQLQTKAHVLTDLALNIICAVISKASFNSPPADLMDISTLKLSLYLKPGTSCAGQFDLQSPAGNSVLEKRDLILDSSGFTLLFRKPMS